MHQTAAHHGRDVRLLDTENLTSSGLSQATLLDETIDLQRQPGLDFLALRVGKSEVSKDIAAAFFHGDLWLFLFHTQCCLSL